MSLRIAPSTAHPTSTGNTSTKSSQSASTSLTAGAPSAPGLPDTLRATSTTNPLSLSPSAPTLQSTHPLESRLAQWTATQDNLKSETLRRTYGIAEPVRRGMELKIVRAGSWRPMALGGGAASVHEDILAGRDADVSWEDVYTDAGRVRGGEEVGGGVLGEIEGGLGMGKF